MNPSRIVIILLALFGFLSACKGPKEAPSENASTAPEEGLIRISANEFEHGGMTLHRLQKHAFPKVIRVSGTIDVPPENRVVISAVYGGYVTKMTLLEGDVVQKGQGVVTLENPDFLVLQQQYLEVSEQLPYLQAEFERQKTLYTEKITSEKVFLKAQSEFKTALARKSSLEGQLKILDVPIEEVARGNLRSEVTLRAPISGRVNNIGVRTGAYVSPATEILEIVNMEHIHLEFLVFEKDISSIREGQEIRFRVPELSNDYHRGTVYLIGSTVDENRTVKVHGHLEEEHIEGLMVGMFVQAGITIPLKAEDANPKAAVWALPETAVVREAGNPYVLVVVSASEDMYTFRKKAVGTGTAANGFIPISDLGELRPDDQVLASGSVVTGMNHKTE